MEELTMFEMESINGGTDDNGKDEFVTIVALATAALTSNPYVTILAAYGASKNYDYQVKRYNESPYDPSTYQHPYRDLN